MTDTIEPNDVDCVLLIEAGYPADESAAIELAAGLPFLQIEIQGPPYFHEFVGEIFAMDRWGETKGLVEVIP